MYMCSVCNCNIFTPGYLTIFSISKQINQLKTVTAALPPEIKYKTMWENISPRVYDRLINSTLLCKGH